ncbi:transposase [Novipirellula aureliae]|nr:transposase [Novipirellula aureliae]
MTLKPLYLPGNIKPAYRLRYGWTGWTSSGDFPAIPSGGLAELSDAWKRDAMRLLRHRIDGNQIQMLFSTKPSVSPAFVAQRGKGRLDHYFRTSPIPVVFSRKVAVRSIGENTNEQVLHYIARQVEKEPFVDPQFANRIAPFTKRFDDVDVNKPIEVKRGRYWYGLHLVLVTSERYRFKQLDAFERIFRWCHAIARKKEYRLGAISVMPDHLHLCLVGTIEQSPEAIALSFQNNLAYAFDQTRIWEPTYYVGTVGAYDMGAVRRVRTDSLTGQARGGLHDPKAT